MAGKRTLSYLAIFSLFFVMACDTEEEPSVKCKFNEDVNIGFYREYGFGRGGIETCQYARAYTSVYLHSDHNFPNQEGGFIFNLESHVNTIAGGCPEFFIRFVSDAEIKTGKKYDALGYVRDGACHTANSVAWIKFSKIDYVNQSVSGTFRVGNSETLRNGKDGMKDGIFQNVSLIH